MTKQELREALKKKRALLSDEEKKRADTEIVRRIADSKAFRRASALLLYAPLRNEVDLLPLVRLARRQGIPVAFPRCDVKTNTMQFYILETDKRLVKGAYGIPEPPEDAPICPLDNNTLCLLPALSFDPSGARIGYGKGYYDRFLEAFEGTAAGVVYRQMMLGEILTEAHDQPVSMIFTDRAVIDCRASRTGQHKDRATSSRSLSWKSFLSSCKRAVISFLKEGEEADIKVPHLPPILVLSTFVLLIVSRLIETNWIDRENEYAAVILLQLLIFLLPAALYLGWGRKKLITRLRLRPIGLRQLWFVVCILVVMITGGLLCSILTGGIASLSGNFTLYDTFMARISGKPLETLLIVLAYALLPAFCEELVYRAILCAEYERFGVAVSVTVSALFFSMLHFSFPLFLTYLLLGLLLAGAMYATRSVFVPFLLHLCYNLFCLFGQPYLSAFYVNAGSNEIFIFCLITLFLLFGALATGEARKIYHRYANANLDSSYTVALAPKQIPRRLIHTLFSPAVALCAVVWLVMAILAVI